MGYKNVHSQMFDVRPLKKSGELDLEKIARIKQVLDLVDWAREEGLWKRCERPTRLKKASVKARRIKKIEQEVKPLISENVRYPKFKVCEPVEASEPTLEEILDVLGRIEEINQRLKAGEIDKPEALELAEEAILEEESSGSEFMAQEEQRLLEAALDETVQSSEEEIPVAIGDQPVEMVETDVVFEAEPSQPVEIVEADQESLAGEVYQSSGLAYEEPVYDLSVFQKQSLPNSPFFENFEEKIKKNIRAGQKRSIKERLADKFFRPGFVFKKNSLTFVGTAILILLVVSGLSLAGRGFSAKSNILSSALEAYRAMLSAKESASQLDFSGAQVNFETAYQNFLQADKELSSLGRTLISVLEKLPGGSQVASGSALIEVGESLAKAGSSFSKIGEIFALHNFGSLFSGNGGSLTQKIVEARGEIKVAKEAMARANDVAHKIKIEDIPEDMRQPVGELKEKMPFIAQALSQLDVWSQASLSILGHSQAKKYLLIFQNPSEARATGGFIGTYGTLTLDEGNIKNLFIDGIFNLDGQLYDKIIPPKPIQKISTAWSTHDANWFADFPLSAQKIMSFYEKSGNETVDGVISITPRTVEDLLSITGPIDLPEYGVSLSRENFLDIIQHKVEVDYDKNLNQPKKILADFAPKFLDKLFEVMPKRGPEIFEVLLTNLREKDILFYFSDKNLENLFAQQGWAGQILETDKDYLNVINTNINGYKTDRVIDQQISHRAEIQADGSIINTVTITRRHNGRADMADWYNKVNADYLRVYVPLGSKLIAASGQTRQELKPPVDYQKLGFKEDTDVKKQEAGTYMDEKSGTKVFVESGKTVFGNWVYVSPGETVTVSYQYLLPFKLQLTADNFSYSLLMQKQAGASASRFESILQLPAAYPIEWQYPDSLSVGGREIRFSDELKTDKFWGIVFGRQ